MAIGSRIEEWPVEERPRERLYHQGAGALADAELLGCHCTDNEKDAARMVGK